MSDDYIDYMFQSLRSAIRVSLPPGGFYDDVLQDLLDFHAHSLANKQRAFMDEKGDEWSGDDITNLIDPFANIPDPDELGCQAGCDNPFCACPGTD